MKVLSFILPVGLGGVERIVSNLFQYENALRPSSNNEAYIAIGESYKDIFCEKFQLTAEDRIFPVNDKNFWNAFIDIKRIIGEVSPDVIHTHARRECFLISLIKELFRKKTIKHVRTQHMAEKPNVKVSFFEKFLFHRNIDVWVATSANLVDTYLKPLNYVDEKKIRVIYNGIDIKKSDFKHDNRNSRLCIISRLSYQKGIDILLNEIRKFPLQLRKKIFIDLWGDGEEKNNILSKIKDFELQDIIHYRGVSYSPTEVLIHYDALLMPSRYEGLPLTMLESMAVKTPVAIHNVGCVDEFLKTGYNGWIIDSNYNWESFFCDVLNTEYDLMSIAHNAEQTYREQFIGQVMCYNYNKVYQEI